MSAKKRICILGLLAALFVIFFIFVFFSKPQQRSDVLKEDGILGVDDSGGFKANAVWVAKNLYRVSTYTQIDDKTYVVFLLEIEPAVESSFEELCRTFNSTPYSTINSYNLADGVNCQGMTCYIADWCNKHNQPYKVSYTPTHTYITVCAYDDVWYEMNFSYNNAFIREVQP